MADSRKVIQDIVNTLQKQGWRTRLGKHIVLYPPDKKYPPVMIAYTPTDGRWYLTMVTKLRRCGANI